MMAYNSKFHRKAGERPKSAKFLKFMEDKMESSRYSRRHDSHRKNSTSTGSTKVSFADDEASQDPSISELALTKLVNMSITHEDRKGYLADLNKFEVRQDVEFSFVDGNNGIDNDGRDDPERSATIRPRKQSISQRLARAERYSKFKDGRQTPKSVDDEKTSDDEVLVTYLSGERDLEEFTSTEVNLISEEPGNYVGKYEHFSPSNGIPMRRAKISDKLKRAAEYAEFSNETFATYKSKSEAKDPANKYKILFVRRNPSNTSELELVLGKEGSFSSNKADIESLLAGQININSTEGEKLHFDESNTV